MGYLITFWIIIKNLYDHQNSSWLWELQKWTPAPFSPDRKNASNKPPPRHSDYTLKPDIILRFSNFVPPLSHQPPTLFIKKYWNHTSYALHTIFCFDSTRLYSTPWPCTVPPSTSNITSKPSIFASISLIEDNPPSFVRSSGWTAWSVAKLEDFQMQLPSRWLWNIVARRKISVRETKAMGRSSQR